MSRADYLQQLEELQLVALDVLAEDMALEGEDGKPRAKAAAKDVIKLYREELGAGDQRFVPPEELRKLRAEFLERLRHTAIEIWGVK